MKNGIILLVIILSALAIGFETIAKVMQWQTGNAGYFTGIALFLLAIVLGTRSRK